MKRACLLFFICQSVFANFLLDEGTLLKCEKGDDSYEFELIKYTGRNSSGDTFSVQAQAKDWANFYRHYYVLDIGEVIVKNHSTRCLVGKRYEFEDDQFGRQFIYLDYHFDGCSLYNSPSYEAYVIRGDDTEPLQCKRYSPK